MRYFSLLIVLTLLFLAGCLPARFVAPPAAPATPASIMQVAPATVSPVVRPVRPAPVPQPTAPAPKPSTPPQPPVGDVSQVPSTLDIPVAFASQAPFGVWDELHGEACEEASMAMVVKHLLGEPMNAHVMEQEILDLVKWQTEHDIPIDANAAEIVTILLQVYGVTASLVENPTVEAIKSEVSKGNLIIIPVAGRLLGNPNFRGDGPIYHVLVIRGYTETEFITNDPGTRLGEGYRYKHSVILNALHDWDHDLAADGEMTEAEMVQGKKVMVVVPSLTK